jgi:hypothetical protein
MRQNMKYRSALQMDVALCVKEALEVVFCGRRGLLHRLDLFAQHANP